MKNIFKFIKLHYKGFIGTIEYNPDDNMYHGHLENTYDTVFYQAHNIIDLRKQFKRAIHWYINSGLIN